MTRITKYSSCPPGNVVRLGGGNTLKFVNLSASNYEMAREVDMNLAEVDMETFRTQDLEQPAFRLTYSSPVNDDMMVRISGTRDRGMDCLLTNSTSFGLDRYALSHRFF